MVDATNKQITAYLCVQVHTFSGVPTEANTVTVTQDGNEIPEFEVSYDPDQQILTVTFTGDAIPLGASSEAIVDLVCEDGGNATSAKTIQTPKLNDVTLEVSFGDDGMILYDISGTAIPASEGSLELEIMLTPDMDNAFQLEDSMESQFFQISLTDTEYSQTASVTVDAPGASPTAHVYVTAVWSLEDPQLAWPQTAETMLEYHIPAVSEIIFDNIYEFGYGYLYTTTAKFINLLDVTPVSMEFFRTEYNWMWDEFRDEMLVYTITEETGLVLNDDGTVTGSYVGSPNAELDIVSREQTGHRWRVVLTYLDAEGNTHTLELEDVLEPLSISFNDLSGTVWQEDGIYHMDFEFFTAINPNLNVGDVLLNSLDIEGWIIDESSLSLRRDGKFVYITGHMETDAWMSPSLHAYLIWTASTNTNMIYSGYGGTGFFPTELTEQTGTALEDGSGFTDAREVHTFLEGSFTEGEGYTVTIRVTLADGTVIEVTPETEDPTGQVVVNWNDQGNLTVTVSQAAVAAGTQTTVERVVTWSRMEDYIAGTEFTAVTKSIAKY